MDIKPNFTHTLCNSAYKNQLIIFSILILAIALRLWGMDVGNLWYDELQSVTHAAMPFSQILESLLTYDPHPPLYYLQLHLWLKLSTDSYWLYLNPLLWGALSIVSIYYVAQRIYNNTVAIIAALLLSLSPYAIAYSQELRMYSWLMFLSPWIYYFHHRLLTADRPAVAATAFCLITLVFLYSHGAAFLILPSLFIHALFHLVTNQPDKRRIILWISLLLFISVCYLPWVIHIFSMKEFAGTDLTFTLSNAIDTLATLITGFGTHSWLISLAAIAAVAALLFYASRNAQRSLLITLAYVVTPIVTLAIVSLLLQPIWFHRSLALYLPFIILVMASALVTVITSRPRAGYILSSLLCLLLCASIVNQIYSRPSLPSPKEAIEAITKMNWHRNIIFTDIPRVTWSTCWYVAGPGSINTLSNETIACQNNRFRVSRSLPPQWPFGDILYLSRPSQELELTSNYHVIDKNIINGFQISRIHIE